jgi:hypothetical protein
MSITKVDYLPPGASEWQRLEIVVHPRTGEIWAQPGIPPRNLEDEQRMDGRKPRAPDEAYRNLMSEVFGVKVRSDQPRERSRPSREELITGIFGEDVSKRRR